MGKQLFFLFLFSLFAGSFLYGAAQTKECMRLSPITFSDEPSELFLPIQHLYTPPFINGQENDFFYDVDYCNTEQINRLKLVVAKIKELMKEASEDEVLAKLYFYKARENKLSLLNHVKDSLARHGVDPNALGADKKPLLVGAGPRLTSLLLSSLADPFVFDCAPIKSAKDPRVKKLLRARMELWGTKLEPKTYGAMWQAYLTWEALQKEQEPLG